MRSNLPGLINDSDEGSDRSSGDGELKKKMKERAEKLAGLFGSRQRDGERGLSTSPWFGMEGRGGFLCALFRAEVLTEGP